MTDLELLLIVITLKEFRSILLRQKIILYTDYKNLASNLAYLMSQKGLIEHLLIKEYGIEIKYI